MASNVRLSIGLRILVCAALFGVLLIPHSLARAGIGAYVDRYHDRPHQFLSYRTPNEVADTWENPEALLKSAA